MKPSAGRVLVVTSNFPRWRGDSTTPFVLHLAQDLQALGWRIDVLAPHAPGCAKSESIDGVRVERFAYLWPEQLETVCYQGGALINLRRHRSNVLKLPALVAAEWAALIRRLVTRRYNLLHSHWILPQGFTGVLSGGVLRVPHVLTVHGGDIFSLQGRVLGWFKRFALCNANAVTVNSSATERAVTAVADVKERLHRIPMGVSTRAGDARTAGLAQALRNQYRVGAGPLLVYVGRIVEEKGIADIIHAVSLLWPTYAGIRVLLVGEGQERERFQVMANELGLSDRVIFTGWVAPGDVPAYLAAGDVFVGPSRRTSDGWMEAQGLTFLEAMVAGTPVIATRVGGIIDAVRHDETGLLVNERSPEEIAVAVERIIQDSELREGLIRAARQTAVSGFSREATAKAFAELYGQLAA